MDFVCLMIKNFQIYIKSNYICNILNVKNEWYFQNAPVFMANLRESFTNNLILFFVDLNGFGSFLRSIKHFKNSVSNSNYSPYSVRTESKITSTLEISPSLAKLIRLSACVNCVLQATPPTQTTHLPTRSVPTASSQPSSQPIHLIYFNPLNNILLPWKLSIIGQLTTLSGLFQRFCNKWRRIVHSQSQSSQHHRKRIREGLWYREYSRSVRGVYWDGSQLSNVYDVREMPVVSAWDGKLQWEVPANAPTKPLSWPNKSRKLRLRCSCQ